jgi:4-amino-4-deoxy-L-arabinose transferase-like glycosyltransferase
VNRLIWIVAAGVIVFHLATATIYGYHRDEFYYLAQGRHLAWGFVDNPPVTPFLYRVGSSLFGTSRFALAIVPALLHAALVVVVALTARELGGNGRAQVLASLGAAVAPIFVTTGHFLGTVTPELVAGGLTTLFVARVLHTGDARWWLAAGVAFGIGLLDHWTMAPLAAGVVIGIACTDSRALLLNRWALAGGLIAAIIVTPNLVWQAQHDWPQLTFAKQVRDYGTTPKVVPAQFFLFGGVSVLLVIPGVIWLLRNPDARPFRVFAIAYFVVLVFVLVSGGKEYYTAAALPVLIAAGGVACARTSGWALPAWILGTGIVFAPLATPLLPISTANTIRAINPEIGEMIGWSHAAAVVDEVARAHPGAPIVTQNYSEAGAIELLAKRRAYSGHLAYWYWGHPTDSSAETIIVGIPRERLLDAFTDVVQVATISTPGGVRNQEDGTPVWICTGRRHDWAQLWPGFRRY